MDDAKRGFFVKGILVLLKLPDPADVADEGEGLVEDVARACRAWARECEDELEQLLDKNEDDEGE